MHYWFNPKFQRQSNILQCRDEISRNSPISIGVLANVETRTNWSFWNERMKKSTIQACNNRELKKNQRWTQVKFLVNVGIRCTMWKSAGKANIVVAFVVWHLLSIKSTAKERHIGQGCCRIWVVCAIFRREKELLKDKAWLKADSTANMGQAWSRTLEHGTCEFWTWLSHHFGRARWGQN